MKVVRSSDHAWQPVGIDGIEKAVLWRGGHEVIGELFRLKAGADYPPHTHVGWEQMFMISGRILIDDSEELGPGEYCFTAPGETHHVQILEDTVIFLSFGKHYTPES